MTTAELTHEELQFGIDNGILEADEIHSRFNMSKRQDTLNRFTEQFGFEPKEIQTGKYKGAWYIELPNKDKRTKKRKKTKKEIEDLIIEFMKEFDNNPTLHELFERRLDYLVNVKGRSKKTRDDYRIDYKRHFSEFGEQRIKNVRPNQIVELIESEVSAKELKSKAYQALKRVMRMILTQAVKEQLITWDYEKEVFRKLEITDSDFKPVFKEDYELVYDEEETAKAMKYLNENPSVRNMATMLMFFSGMRVGEVVALKHEDIDPVTNTVKVRRSEHMYKGDDGKNVFEVTAYVKTWAGFRTIPLPDSASPLLQKLYFMSTNSEYVFEENGKRIRTQDVRNNLKRHVCKENGIFHKSPHKIRATYDTILLDSGVDARTVKDVMGHSNISVSENNYHRNRKKLKDEQQIINNIDEFSRFNVG